MGLRLHKKVVSGEQSATFMASTMDKLAVVRSCSKCTFWAPATVAMARESPNWPKKPRTASKCCTIASAMMNRGPPTVCADGRFARNDFESDIALSACALFVCPYYHKRCK